MMQENSEDTKSEMRSHKSKDRQYRIQSKVGGLCIMSNKLEFHDK
jgi:hypothetical protein